MKIRKGFVSNSSSSSFICEVCGNVESGYDASAKDCGFYVCEHGHTFCVDHILPAPVKAEPAPDAEHVEGDDHDHDDEEEFDEDGGYDVPESRCPICQLAAVSDSDMVRYLLKKNGETEAEVVASIKEAFHDYDAFMQFLRGH